MFTHLIILAFVMAVCSGYAEYELFPGFNLTTTTADDIITINSTDLLEKITTKKVISEGTEFLNNIEATTLHTSINKNASSSTIKFKCPEKESPKNIGPYEVPTQRDMMMLTKHILLKLYYTYNQESLQLLKDIKEATKAALKMELKCYFNKKQYTQCVKNVSKQYELFTKDALMNLEHQKFNVTTLIENEICNWTDIKTDPLQLIKLLAQEKTTLHFVLPSFLILLHSCNLYCSKSNTNSNKKKPIRHMTDQDLVINHFLTKKSYIQLINDSKHTV